MQFDEMVRARRSIRGFKKDPVPRQVLEEIVDLATGAPSSMNTQPWYFHIVTGEPLDRIRQGNTERTLAGVQPSREIPMHGGYEGIHRRRQDWVLRGFRQFDAPVSIVVTYDKSLEPGATVAHFDLGAVTYGLVLAAWSRGLGSVINGQGIMQSPVVREHAQIPDDQVIMTCVAMGYPDDSFVANTVKSRRRPVGEVATFVGFDEAS